MNQKTGFDPVANWQEMVQKWEQEVNNWSSKFTETEQFGATMSQATKMSMVAQKALNDRMESLLRSLNLPSKTQVEALGERLDAIEEAIERLRLSLEPGAQIPDAPSPVPAPSRTRKPPAAAQ
jgi:SMC interacting uncharacterized protein involved in chromosome segregation